MPFNPENKPRRPASDRPDGFVKRNSRTEKSYSDQPASQTTKSGTEKSALLKDGVRKPKSAGQPDAASRPVRAPRPSGDRPYSDRPARAPRPSGDRPYGDRPARAPRPAGDRPYGDRPARAPRPEGDRPYGDRPARAPRPAGDRPYGDRPARAPRPAGDRPYGDRPARAPRPAGDRPYGDRPARAPRPAGDRPYGDRPARAPRPAGDRPYGDRPARAPRPAGDRPYSDRPARAPRPEAEPKDSRPFVPSKRRNAFVPERDLQPVQPLTVQAPAKPADVLAAPVDQHSALETSAFAPAMVKTKRASKTQPAAARNTAGEIPRLKVIPLGGMREIGKNMTVYEYGDQMIIVDCGIAFPEEDMPGIDVVIPDFSYITQNLSKLKGIFITHGHEDHIGALPYLLKDVKVPLYSNHLTIELIRRKIEDRGTGVTQTNLIKVSDGSIVSVGDFSVEFIHVNHSIEDANALVIRTPAGIIYHSGDFKIDHTPIHGGPMDLTRIGAIGDEGVLLMVCESTNIEKKGYTPSERKVGESLSDIFSKASGRIFVTTFSSNVSRVQQIFTAAEAYDRKVALVGRSMINVFDAANSLGYIEMKPDTLIDVTQIDRFPADKLVLITTGSQGEPMSALTRMAFSEHRTVEIVPGDTVILSSSAIPGNEKSVYRVINELYKRGAHVIYESLSEIHVSGHAYQEELKLLHNLVRPKFFIPAHGEYRHLYRHAELANSLGTPWEKVFLLGNGDIFEYQPEQDKAAISGFVQADGVLIDGSGVGSIDNLVLRDRRLLSDDGVVAVFIAIDAERNEIKGQPDIQTRGFMYESENDRIIQETQKKIHAFAKKADQGNKPLAPLLSSNQLKDQLRDLLFERTRRRPVILLSVVTL